MHLVEWQREVFPSLLYSIILHNHQSSPKTRLGRLTGSRDSEQQQPPDSQIVSSTNQNTNSPQTDSACRTSLRYLKDYLLRFSAHRPVSVSHYCVWDAFRLKTEPDGALQALIWAVCVLLFFPGWMIYFVFVCRIFFLNGLYPTRCFKHQRRSFWARSIKLSKTSEKHKVKLQTSHKTKLTTNFKSREPGRC